MGTPQSVGQDFLALKDRSVDRRLGYRRLASEFAEALHDHVKDWDEEYGQHGRGDHSAEDGRPECLS